MTGSVIDSARPADRSTPLEDRLGEVVALVEEDAQERPAAYLEDALVPEGGE